jgi:2-hydroxycyclohexanecarboxyl-CoA dehydrogenase
VLEGTLTGRTAVVTGGASGIGAAICADLAACGAAVVVADLNLDAARARAAGLAGARAVQVDLSDEREVDRFVALLHAEGPPPDVLVSCAGQALVGPFVGSARVDWDRMYRLNLRAPMQLTQLLLPAMNAAGWGRLVFVSSDSARAGSAGEAAYAAAKAGLFGFAKSIAREHGRAGVTSNVVCPGATDTPMLRTVAAENPGLVPALSRMVPLGRIGLPEDVAATVALLCSQRGGYLTGQTLSVSGGITMH